VSQKNLTTLKLYIISINFDDIWQKCSKYTRIEFAQKLKHANAVLESFKH